MAQNRIRKQNGSKNNVIRETIEPEIKLASWKGREVLKVYCLHPKHAPTRMIIELSDPLAAEVLGAINEVMEKTLQRTHVTV